VVVQPTSAVGGGTTVEILDSAVCRSPVTDPDKLNNRASIKTVVNLVPLGHVRLGNTLTLSWPAAAGNYALETTTNLVSGTWIDVTNPAPSLGGGQMTISVPVSSGSRYYRLRLK